MPRVRFFCWLSIAPIVSGLIFSLVSAVSLAGTLKLGAANIWRRAVTVDLRACTKKVFRESPVGGLDQYTYIDRAHLLAGGAVNIQLRQPLHSNEFWDVRFVNHGGGRRLGTSNALFTAAPVTNGATFLQYRATSLPPGELISFFATARLSRRHGDSIVPVKGPHPYMFQGTIHQPVEIKMQEAWQVPSGSYDGPGIFIAPRTVQVRPEAFVKLMIPTNSGPQNMRVRTGYIAPNIQLSDIIDGRVQPVVHGSTPLLYLSNFQTDPFGTLYVDGRINSKAVPGRYLTQFRFQEANASRNGRRRLVAKAVDTATGDSIMQYRVDRQSGAGRIDNVIWEVVDSRLPIALADSSTSERSATESIHVTGNGAADHTDVVRPSQPR